LPIQRNFSDFNLDFIAHPQTGDIVKIKDIASVIQSLRVLVLTNFYEKPFHPEIGSNITAMLFENVNNQTSGLIKDAIEEMISEYEPRVELIEIDVETDVDETGYNIAITFRIQNILDPISINLFLSRVR